MNSCDILVSRRFVLTFPPIRRECVFSSTSAAHTAAGDARARRDAGAPGRDRKAGSLVSVRSVPRTPQPQTSTSRIEDSAAGVNNFVLVVATVNGSGSQTANTCLLRAFFKMGIPVSGKNIFPSNIQGLPTWFQIRVSEEGYIGRRDSAEIVVA